jgi:DNA-binding SARP family transcriptional activator
MSQSLVLSMLGGFELRRGSMPQALPPGIERVVAYVALLGHPASRSSIAGSLWLDVPEERAMANLRSALWRLRHLRLSLVDSVGNQLALSPDVSVDVHQLSTAARHVLDGSMSTDAAEIEVLASSGDLLTDWAEEWVVVQREQFRQLRLHALERIAAHLADSGQYGRAAEVALAAIASEPLRESAHRVLIEVHLAEGNRLEAIRQYCAYGQLMRDELDLEPSSQVRDLLAGVPDTTLNRVCGAH